MWNWIKRRRESRRLAAKHAAWRAELDNLGVWAVQQDSIKLAQNMVRIYARTD